MTTSPFTDGWTIRAADAIDTTAVSLPHDAMLSEKRSREGATGSHGGYFPGGRYVYAKTWIAPEGADNRLSLLFEGVYGDTEVRLNGHTIAESLSGYREFAAPLDGLKPGEQNLIEVEVDNSAVPNSRWYTGTGIYRPVWLVDEQAVRFAADGVSMRTVSIDGAAIVEVRVDVAGATSTPVTVSVQLGDATRTAEVVDGRAVLELAVPQPRLWSAESPHLYAATVELVSGGRVVDSRQLSVGLRTVTVDAQHGLRVNGETVLLRGACVHHDSGILGAATHRAFEFRRARILKENGFNAVRSSHNPLSRDLLEACDELGLYVLDELTDVWFVPKSAHDSAPRFEQLWRDDARSMVAKDRNHASVIMYSIGNEIAESGSERGIQTAHAISDFVRDLDPTRPTTLAVNFLLNFMASSGKSLFDTSEHTAPVVEKNVSPVTSTVANVMANKIGGIMQLISKLPKADAVTKDTFPAVDVAGYNYAWGRYAGDAKRHPDRVVLGTESMPGDIPKIWALTESLPNVIGDFVWTGWDYLGETGIGTWGYGGDSAGIGKKFPELVAGCGLIDITGRPTAAMLLSRATWGQLEAPQLAVRPLDHAGEKTVRTAWRSTDAVQSWAWAGSEGKRAEIEVYSDDDEVEVSLNGRSLGRRPAGKRRGFVTRYRVAYEPGELLVVGYRNGVEVSRSSLRSAAAPSIRISAENAELVDGLGFVNIELADENGVVESLAHDVISIEVSSGELAALGSSAPATTESYTDAEHSTWRGRAFAVVRATQGGGDIQVSVTTTSHGSATITLASAPVHAV